MIIFPSIGGATYTKGAHLVIRLIRKGCANRPFYLISVQEKVKEQFEPTIEQLGSYDPLPNKFNEKLVAINFTRLEHWLKEGVELTVPVLKLLGLCGYFPIHPDTFIEAHQRRNKINETLEELKAAAANLTASEAIEPSSDSVPLESDSETKMSDSKAEADSSDSVPLESDSETKMSDPQPPPSSEKS